MSNISQNDLKLSLQRLQKREILRLPFPDPDLGINRWKGNIIIQIYRTHNDE